MVGRSDCAMNASTLTRVRRAARTCARRIYNADSARRARQGPPRHRSHCHEEPPRSRRLPARRPRPCDPRRPRLVGAGGRTRAGRRPRRRRGRPLARRADGERSLPVRRSAGRDPRRRESAARRRARRRAARQPPSTTASRPTPWLLAPCDLQAIKAAGVTFVASMLERVIEEQARGDAGEGARPCASRSSRSSATTCRAIRPGSPEAARLKEALIARGRVVAVPRGRHRSRRRDLHQGAADVGGRHRRRGRHPSRSRSGTTPSRRSCWP